MKKILALSIALLLAIPILAFAKNEVDTNLVSPVIGYLDSGSSLVHAIGDTNGNQKVLAGGIQTVVPTTPTITAQAYTTGKIVGGVISIASATRYAAGTGIVSSILLTDKANQKAAIDVFFFNANPTNSTLTDTSTFTVNAADIGKYAGHISILASDYAVDSAYAYASIINKNLAFKLASGTTLYAVMVVRGSYTYASTSDLTLTAKIYQD